MDGQWEVVTGDKKKKGTKLTKTEKKKLADNMPKIDPRMAAAKIGSIYADYDEPDQGKASSSGKQNGHASGDTVVTKEHKKKAEKSPKRSVKDSLKQIDGNEILDNFKKFQKLYPKKPLIWFSEVAAHIEMLFDVNSDKDPTNQSESREYPLNQLTPEAVRKLKHLPTCVSVTALDDFLQLAAEKIADGVGKNQTTFGWKLLGQVVANHRPQAALAHPAEMQKLLANERANNVRFLSAAWCAMQAGYASPKDVGLRVLLDYLMPYVHIKGLAPAVVSYAEIVLSGTGADAVSLKHQDFFPLLDVCLGSSELGLPQQLTRRLSDLFPFVRKHGLEAAPEEQMKHYFPGLLIRLRPATASNQKSPNSVAAAVLEVELLSALMHCIARAPQVCCGLWKDLHVSGEATSSTTALLWRLDKEWNVVEQTKGLLKHLRETLLVIIEHGGGMKEDEVPQKKSKSASNGSPGKKPSAVAVAAAQVASGLLDRTEKTIATGGVFCRCYRLTKRLLFSALLIGLILLAIDMHLVKWDWSKTQTATFLKDAKLPVGVKRIQTALEPTVQWIWIKGLQPAWQRVSKVATPYVQQAHKQLEPIAIDVWNKTRELCNQYWPIVVEWLVFISEATWNAMIQAAQYLSNFLRLTIVYVTNLELCCIKRAFVNTFETVNTYTVSAFEYILQVFNQGSTST